MDQRLPGSSSSSSSSRAPRTGDRQNQIIPALNPNPAAPCLAYRIIRIQDQREIISVLSATATRYGQSFYVSHVTGYVSQATYFPLAVGAPCRHEQFENQIAPAHITYMTGWFHPILEYPNHPPVPARLDNAVLHVNFAHVQGHYLATTLLASGPVEVTVFFVCGTESAIQPCAEGEHSALYTIIPE